MTSLRLGLLACPAGHSVSPDMHEAALRDVGLEGAYLAFDVPPPHLEAAVRGLAALGFTGVNVSVPHKVEALRLADAASAHAVQAGAANTLVFSRQGSGLRIEAHNTDVTGFLEAWEEAFGGGSLEGSRALVLGAGGAARAVVLGLLSGGVAGLDILNRSADRARDLVQALEQPLAALPGAVRRLPLDDERFAQALEDCDVVVQATSAQITAEAPVVAWPPRLSRPIRVMDIVYRPRITPFLFEAATRGADVAGGLGMLVAQGALSFELWTGRRPWRRAMRDAAERALGGVEEG